VTELLTTGDIAIFIGWCAGSYAVGFCAGRIQLYFKKLGESL